MTYKNDTHCSPKHSENAQIIVDGVYLLPEYAYQAAPEWIQVIHQIQTVSPFRKMKVPGHRKMSVAMTNCGSKGWISDETGYRYSSIDPLTKHPWPSMPDPFFNLATQAAIIAGFHGFIPDACLINDYELGASLGLHRDQDEQDFSHPIVSVSLGLSAFFRLGGLRRKDPTQIIELHHGDVLVWGGPARLYYHGIRKLNIKPLNGHPLTGRHRYNLTFRLTGLMPE